MVGVRVGVGAVGEVGEVGVGEEVVDVAEGVGEDGAQAGLGDVFEDDVGAVGDELGCFGCEGGGEGVEGCGDEDGVVGEGEEVGERGGGEGFGAGGGGGGAGGGFGVDSREDDAFVVVGGDVEVVEEDEEGHDRVFGWEAALDGGFGIALVAHFALDHADEVGSEDSGDGRDDVGDDGSLGGCERLLDDLVHNVHHVVDSGGDVWGIRG